MAKTATDESELWEWFRKNDIHLSDLMSDKMREEILVWAQNEVEAGGVGGEGADWWSDIHGIWDINIWDDEEKDNYLAVVAYLIYNNCQDTDCDNWVELGYVRSSEHPSHGRQEDIDDYLDRYGYSTVEEWAEDSNYILRDGNWYAQDGTIIDPATCLIESINELIREYE